MMFNVHCLSFNGILTHYTDATYGMPHIEYGGTFYKKGRKFQTIDNSFMKSSETPKNVIYLYLSGIISGQFVPNWI